MFLVLHNAAWRVLLVLGYVNLMWPPVLMWPHRATAMMLPPVGGDFPRCCPDRQNAGLIGTTEPQSLSLGVMTRTTAGHGPVRTMTAPPSLPGTLRRVSARMTPRRKAAGAARPGSRDTSRRRTITTARLIMD
jgi:hypothetical protein